MQARHPRGHISTSLLSALLCIPWWEGYVVKLRNLVIVAGLFAAWTGSASAQTFISCRSSTEYGSSWLSATYAVSSGSLQVWNSSSGWSNNYCGVLGNCYFSEDAYVFQYQSRNQGQYAYGLQDNTITLQRRTGVIIHDYVEHVFNLADNRPNPYNNPLDGTSKRNGIGTCEPAANPSLAAPKF